jgi:hypothetical protein
VSVLSAYWGADDTINVPGGVRAPICTDPTAHDALPVTFSERIDPSTVHPGRFQVDGTKPACTTLQPAGEPNERMTVVLFGDFGDSASSSDAPGAKETLQVQIDGLRTVGGQIVQVSVTSTPLNPGERLVWAERRTRADARPGGRLTEAAAWDLVDEPCGTAPELSALRLVFSGGITDADDPGPALDAEDLADFTITWSEADTTLAVTHPVAFGDQGDRDNVLDLCLPVRLPPEAVAAVDVTSGAVLDPAGAPNPATSIALR